MIYEGYVAVPVSILSCQLPICYICNSYCNCMEHSPSCEVFRSLANHVPPTVEHSPSCEAFRSSVNHVRPTVEHSPSCEACRSSSNHVPPTVEHSPPCEAFRSSSNHVPPILCNLKIHYPAYKSPPLVPFLSLINPFHTLPSSYFKIHHYVLFLLHLGLHVVALHCR